MKTVLIKCGGSTIEELSKDFFSSLHELRHQGYKIIIVHGGGPDINQMLKLLNVEPEFVNGLRKTSKATLKVVETVLSGQTNRKLVEKLTEHGLKAIGLNGSDADLLKGSYIDKDQLGYVGDVTSVNSEFLELILKRDLIPVITPIALAEDGAKLNVNADYAAAAIARALKVDQCLFVTDVEGIMINGSVKKSISVTEIESYINHGQIYGGMVPKVVSAITALEKGIEGVRIVAGKKGFYENQLWLGTKIIGRERIVE
ncbi:acetylglutamate kinase [Robertmurraya andreesenii]|uniref:Acetylglutamate kinase n=1 Tax=Anoxybacillus andreesenii TaxID=1325932 RepID=A0ABT9UYV1_9BACL|nr:acetylglutamate kinase [Robertmurraya andreesenii]MDQ0153875.1 acetylglutamate kinase [Robertmurraya andreesenii]